MRPKTTPGFRLGGQATRPARIQRDFTDIPVPRYGRGGRVYDDDADKWLLDHDPAYQGGCKKRGY